jgi:hypothetical protein
MNCSYVDWMIRNDEEVAKDIDANADLRYPDNVANCLARLLVRSLRSSKT